jgi:hypothetical protein
MRRVPEGLGRGGLVVDVVEGVDLAEGAEGAFEIVNYRAGHEGLCAVGGETGAEVDVMVDGRLGLVWGVGKVGFLGASVRERSNNSMNMISYLCVPKVSAEVVGLLAEL